MLDILDKEFDYYKIMKYKLDEEFTIEGLIKIEDSTDYKWFRSHGSSFEDAINKILDNKKKDHFTICPRFKANILFRSQSPGSFI